VPNGTRTTLSYQVEEGQWCRGKEMGEPGLRKMSKISASKRAHPELGTWMR